MTTTRTGELWEMYYAQRELQAKAYGKDPGQIENPEELIQFIKDMNLALQDELHEFLGEVGWKPWATSRHINVELAMGELVDAWHFFMNLMLAIGMTPDDLFVMYMEKRGRNIQRQVDGYDGVGGKCQNCRRDLSDIAAKQKLPLAEVWSYRNGMVICITCSTIEEVKAAEAEVAEDYKKGLYE